MHRILATLAAALFASSALASSPSLGNVLPKGVQRGIDAVVLMNGARLGDAKEILWYTSGLATTKLEVVNDNQLRVAIKVSPDCTLGEHALRIRCGSGISELRTLYVGALPQIDEKEPNGEFTTPQKIPLNVTIQGVIDNEDVDYFLVEAKKGQRITAEVEAMRLGHTLFDTYVAIMDMKRFELAASDDAPLLGQDAVAQIVAPADGSYVIQVRESAYGGNGECRYRLHVGTFPRPTAVIPAGGKMADEIEVTFLGDVVGPFKQKLKLPSASGGRFGLFAQDAGGIAPSPVPFRLTDLGSVVEIEPNDSHAQATKLDLSMAANGVIGKPGDVDYFRFTAKKGQTLDVHCYARRLGSALDPVMVISHLNGGAIIGNDDGIGPDSYFRFTVPEDKEYVLSIQDHLGKGGDAYTYRVELTPVVPRYNLTIPKVAFASQDRQTIAVPRGNRYVALFHGQRVDFGGETVIGLENLPKGLKISHDAMLPYVEHMPIVFEAAPDAPIAGTLAQVTARHVDPKLTLKPQFSQVVDLVTGGPNQSVYWTYTVDRPAVAVTEEVPFKISIVEPKVPLVHNGSMNLRIVAERKKGFNESITIYPIFNPPGVGSVGAATIAAGQAETTFLLNANTGAPARPWKYVVMGVANVGNGPVWVSSQLATIEVAPPFATFAMERAAGEQGKATELFCKVQQATPFEGQAQVTLVGLPPNVTAPPIAITKDTKEFAFKLTLAANSPAGTHKNLFCQMIVQKNGEPILHNLYGSELRVDVPIAPKAAEPVKAAAAAPAAKPVEAPKPTKRLTRLEQLRLDQEEREKAGKK